jgi:superfamily II DNA or RNA helicase
VVYESHTKYPKIRAYLDERTLEKYRNMLLVEMPYLKHTTRVVEEVWLEHDHELFRKVVKSRWNPYTEKPMKDVAELFRVMRRVVNSDPSRQDAVQQLLSEHPRIIVFYNFNYELDALRSLAQRIGVPVAEWNGHKHQPIPTTEKWLYLVQYVAGAEGWNCVETDAMVFYSLTYSYKNFEQAMGRIDRLNTPYTTLFYYVFLSNSAIDRAVRVAQRKKKMFNERSWAKARPEFGGGFEE